MESLVHWRSSLNGTELLLPHILCMPSSYLLQSHFLEVLVSSGEDREYKLTKKNISVEIYFIFLNKKGWEVQGNINLKQFRAASESSWCLEEGVLWDRKLWNLIVNSFDNSFWVPRNPYLLVIFHDLNISDSTKRGTQPQWLFLDIQHLEGISTGLMKIFQER